MWLGSNQIIGGVVLLLWVSCSFSVWAQGSTSPKQQAIALSLNQETLLLQAEKDMSSSRQAMLNSEQLLQQTQKDDAEKYNELLTQFEARKALYEKLKMAYEELLKSIEQSERLLKASRSEADFWRGCAVVVGIVGAGYVIGDRVGWW